MSIFNQMSNMVCLQRICICAGLLALLGATGCGGKSVPTGTVTGKVLLNGQPYTDADVIFLSLQSGQGSTGTLQEGGTFRLAEPIPVGTYRVYLAPKAGDPEAPPAPVKIDAAVPDKYWNESTSDLQQEIIKGANDVVIELSK